MGGTSEFDQVRREPDPIRRGRRATELITLYQQRAAELARLRREAIEEAHRTGLNYTEIAELLGITKGRISQIKSGAPPAERAFFGVGPVAVGIPRREEKADATDFDASDRAARQLVEKMLARLSLASSRFEIDPDTDEVPAGDTVVICDPGAAPVAHELLTTHEALSLQKVDGEWCLVDTATGNRYTAPAERSTGVDIGFLGRREEGGRVIVQIAGVTRAGSHGVAHWLDNNVSALYEPTLRSVGAIIESDVNADLEVTDSRAVAGPFTTSG